MTQARTGFQLETAMPAILAAQTAYQGSLQQLASWVRTDKARSENMIPDTREHLIAGLAVLESVSNTAGESVQAHDIVSSRLHHEAVIVGQLMGQRNRYAGTAPHLARLFDQLGLRLAHLGGSNTYAEPTSSRRMAN